LPFLSSEFDLRVFARRSLAPQASLPADILSSISSLRDSDGAVRAPGTVIALGFGSQLSHRFAFFRGDFPSAASTALPKAQFRAKIR
jgi:hypothetical protein